MAGALLRGAKPGASEDGTGGVEIPMVQRRSSRLRVAPYRTLGLGLLEGQEGAREMEVGPSAAGG